MKFRFLRKADELVSNLQVCFHNSITVIFSVIRVHDRNNFILLITIFDKNSRVSIQAEARADAVLDLQSESSELLL